MAAKSNLTNMVLCLTSVCLICAAMLGGVYVLTYQPILDASEKALKESVGKVLPDGGEISEAKTAEFSGVTYEYYENVMDGTVNAYAVKSATNGFGGQLLLMVGVLPDGTIHNTEVLSHSETPGLGAKCNQDAHFIEQWRGFGPEKKIAVKKDGGDVDAITASTITSRAYALAVSNAVNFVKSLNGWATDAATGASALIENKEAQK